MEHPLIENQTIGEIVANDFRTSSVFKKAGIDFCCGGNKLLMEVCLEKGIESKELEKELEKVSNEPVNEFMEFKNWDSSFLCDYIVNTHHKFVLKSIPELQYYTQKIALVHGTNHDELNIVAQLFEKLSKELLQHLKNEEEILFPAIKELNSNKTEQRGSKENIGKIISDLFSEHEIAGGIMDEINRITNGYMIPDDACNTYKVAFKMLEQFEDDLHIHVHLENNILFPKARNLS